MQRLAFVLMMFATSLFGITSRTGRPEVVIPATEVIGDNLFAAGESVRVEGTVDGDLIAFARRVEIRGTVKGDVVAFGQEIEVSGTVEGNTVAFGQSCRFSGTLGRNVYCGAQNARLTRDGHVAGDAVLFGAYVNAEGDVGRSLRIYSQDAVLAGSVARNVDFYGRRMTVDQAARVEGNLVAHVSQSENLSIASGAAVKGQISRVAPIPRREPSVAGAVLFAGWRLLAAMAAGWLFYKLFPGFVENATAEVSAVWRDIGVGLAVLLVTPVLLVATALTLVGVPVAVIAGSVYLTLMYLAKIPVALFVGRWLLHRFGREESSVWSALLAGLVILVAISYLPFGLGFLAGLITLCLGLGAIVWRLYSRRIAPTVAAA